MGIERFRAALTRQRRVAIDSSIFIYQLEENPRYVAFSDALFAWLERTGSSAVTSTITMTELLVQPYRDHDDERADEFYALLSTYPNLEWIAPDLEIADIAARLRGVHHLRTPDALQAATTLQAGATALVSNKPIFERVGRFHSLILDRFI